MKNKKFNDLIICVMIPVILGILVGLITSRSIDYNALKLPFFAPKPWVFPFVWTILYALMGFSSYLIGKSRSRYKNEALGIYVVQLVVNLLWSIIFFTLKLRFLAFLVIIGLIILVVLMIKSFYKVNKTASIIQIPYLIWLIFASILNLSILFLN